MGQAKGLAGGRPKLQCGNAAAEVGQTWAEGGEGAGAMRALDWAATHLLLRSLQVITQSNSITNDVAVATPTGMTSTPTTPAIINIGNGNIEVEGQPS